MAVVELQTRYLVQAVWAASGHAKRGQPAKAAAEVRFLPQRHRRQWKVPTVAQLTAMIPPSSRTRVHTHLPGVE